MYSVLKTSAGIPQTQFHIDTNGERHIPISNDTWIFTDPGAISKYLWQGRLDQLIRDICTYVMYDGRWSQDELEFSREIYCLCNVGVLVPELAFGHLSPHPTIYRAIESGAVEIAGEKHYFDIGDEIVFEPWLSRLYHPGLAGPLRIGRLGTTQKCYLSCEAFPYLTELCAKDLDILRCVLNYSRRRA